MKKMMIVFLMVLLLLSSCKAKKKDVIVLASECGMEMNSVVGRSSSTVVIPEHLVADLMAVSGLDEEALAVELFGAVPVTVAEPKAYANRERLYQTLEKNTGTSSKTEVLKKERKAILDSSFMSSLDNMAEGYDKALLEMVKKSHRPYAVFDADKALGGTVEGEEDIIFLKNWIKAIIS